MKAVRNTVSNEREKWKESMQKELKGLMDRDTYEEVPSEQVPISQVQNAPARMGSNQLLKTMVPGLSNGSRGLLYSGISLTHTARHQQPIWMFQFYVL
eukprot:657550-Amphidinium_carterae.1